MEKKIRNYENFIREASEQKLNKEEKTKLAKYHSEMMKNFQHERLIQLLVTLFFAFVTLAPLFIVLWMTITYETRQEIYPLYVLAIILAVLTGFYVKHYYFLENHIQGLYKYTEKLGEINEFIRHK